MTYTRDGVRFTEFEIDGENLTHFSATSITVDGIYSTADPADVGLEGGVIFNNMVGFRNSICAVEDYGAPDHDSCFSGDAYIYHPEFIPDEKIWLKYGRIINSNRQNIYDYLRR